MQVDLINNTGISQFGRQLEEQMQTSKNFEIASAFITKEAIQLLRIFLEKNKNKERSGKLITGLYQCFNSKEVLISLQELARKSKGRLQIKISFNLRFHWKFYFFEHSNKHVSFIGSANFTGSGLSKEGELISKLVLFKNEKQIIENLYTNFNREWENSGDVLKFPVEDYNQAEFLSTAERPLALSIRNFLSNQNRVSINLKSSPIARAVLLSGYLTNKTIKSISKHHSDWDIKKYYYYCYTRKSEFDADLKCDLIFLIEKKNKKFQFSFVTIKDSCTLRTSDGTYFIAYNPNKKVKLETKPRREFLEKLGLNYHSRSFTEKTLGVKQTKNLMENFG